MEIAELFLKYLEVIIWPAVITFVAIRFQDEVKKLIDKALSSHELEIDVLGQKIKLKAIEELTSEVSTSHKIEDAGVRQHNNDFVALHFARIISQLTSHEVMSLRHIAREMDDHGYTACEAERRIMDKFQDLKILDRDSRGFYLPTEQGKKLLYTLKNL